MMPPKTSVIAFIFMIGVISSQCVNTLSLLDSSAEVDPDYRPWVKNDTSAVWISLEGMRMAAINHVFRVNVPGLKWLVMDDNQIEIIPSESFKFLPDLTYISLARNQISKIELGAFSHLEKLRVIDLDTNPLGYDFNSIVFNEVPSLERLYLRDCKLSSFDVPKYLEKLSHLHLSGNQLNSFRADNYPALSHLYLSNDNLAHVSLSRLESLIYLDLSRNFLGRIMFHSTPWPYYDSSSMLSIENVPNLQYLIASSSRISQISSDSFLSAESLVYLDLTNNAISEVLPGTFSSLLYLESILLDSNRMTKINYRTFANLPNLKTISLKNNQISDIDEDAFTNLNSSANEVQLFLDNNKIHTLRKTSFVGIKGLKHIGLSNNRIKVISSYAFVDLPNLESLVIEEQTDDDNDDGSSGRGVWNSQTQLLESKKGIIESHAFIDLPNLTSIIIRENFFTNIESQAFHELPQLKLLDLSENGIQSLSSEAFSDLPMLEHLHLGGNSLSEITPKTFPKQLKYLNLAWNNLCPDFSCWNISQLHQLQELDVCGITDRLKIADIAELPQDLTILFGKAQAN